MVLLQRERVRADIAWARHTLRRRRRVMRLVLTARASSGEARRLPPRPGVYAYPVVR